MGKGKKAAKVSNRAADAGRGEEDLAWAGPRWDGATPEQEEELGRIREAVRSRLSGHRLEHVLGVAASARRLAARFGADPFMAEAAGLLHDWDKKLDRDELWAKAIRYGVVPEQADGRMFPLLHAWTAAASLPEVFPELPREVFGAVGCHTVGDVAMSALDKVVYIADAIEPGRSFDGVGELRELARTGSLDALFAACVRQSIEVPLAQGRYLYPGAVRVWNELCVPKAL